MNIIVLGVPPVTVLPVEIPLQPLSSLAASQLWSGFCGLTSPSS